MQYRSMHQFAITLCTIAFSSKPLSQKIPANQAKQDVPTTSSSSEAFISIGKNQPRWRHGRRPKIMSFMSSVRQCDADRNPRGLGLGTRGTVMKIDEIHLIISTSQPVAKLQTCDDNDDASLSVRPMKDISEEAYNCQHYRDISSCRCERRVYEEEQLWHLGAVSSINSIFSEGMKRGQLLLLLLSCRHHLLDCGNRDQPGCSNDKKTIESLLSRCCLAFDDRRPRARLPARRCANRRGAQSFHVKRVHFGGGFDLFRRWSSGRWEKTLGILK